MSDFCEIMENLAGLSDAEIDRLAESLTERNTGKAERLATMLAFSLQDKQIREDEENGKG